MGLSRADIRVLRQALNEVLNGPEAIEDWEFGTRMGVTPGEARALLQRTDNTQRGCQSLATDGERQRPSGVEASRDGEAVVIRLRYAEAVVLDGLLGRWDQQGVDDTVLFEDQAERRVLWDLTASLEPMIDEIFSGELYDEVLARSREEVRDPVE